MLDDDSMSCQNSDDERALEVAHMAPLMVINQAPEGGTYGDSTQNVNIMEIKELQPTDCSLMDDGSQVSTVNNVRSFSSRIQPSQLRASAFNGTETASEGVGEVENLVMCTDGSIEVMHQPGTHLFSTSNHNITSFGKLEQQTWESVSVNTSVITVERNGYVHRLDPANGDVGRYLVHPS